MAGLSEWRVGGRPMGRGGEVRETGYIQRCAEVGVALDCRTGSAELWGGGDVGVHWERMRSTATVQDQLSDRLRSITSEAIELRHTFPSTSLPEHQPRGLAMQAVCLEPAATSVGVPTAEPRQLRQAIHKQIDQYTSRRILRVISKE